MGRSNMVIEPGPQGRDGRRVRERREETGQWRLLVQHQSGSLDAAVAAVRRRNLGISAGVLLLLTVSIWLLTANARKAHRLARQQVEFVAGVSHELRTPVAVIRSAAENLEQGVVTGERVRQYGTAIGLEARRLGDMVERVLQYSGIESGLTSEQRVPLSAAELVDIALASAAPLVATAGVTVQRELADDLPLVSGDGPALRSAIENLIGNALKYGGADRFVGVSVRAVPLRGRTEVHITVSDHGNGIPAAELPHIFEPFYRGAEATARQVHGNGLGLSLVKRIVEAHGGHVAVDTREGAGTAFTISLPALPPDDRAHRVTGAAHPAHS
jgi:signal transduction histidine kinase